MEVIRPLYDEATSVVLLNGNAVDFFRTTVEVRQECPLSPVLFNIFLEKTMQKPLTPQQSSEYDRFPGDAVEDAGETDNPLSKDDRCATCGLTTTSIC